jgi:hypothetical protein
VFEDVEPIKKLDHHYKNKTYSLGSFLLASVIRNVARFLWLSIDVVVLCTKISIINLSLAIVRILVR